MKKACIFLIISVMLVMSILSAPAGTPAQAQTFQDGTTTTVRYVSPNGICYGLSPCYASLQAAVDAANPDDTLKLVTGRYTGVSTREGHTQLVYIDKTLTIEGGYLPDWTLAYSSVDPSILDAEGQGRVLFVSGNVTVTLKGLNITGGAGPEGGGVYSQGANLTLLRCQVYANQAETLGGGLYLSSGSLNTRDSQFFQNQAAQGGGLYLAGSATGFEIVNTLIYNNTAGSGGGLVTVGANGSLINPVIAENQATQTSGAAGLQVYSPSLSLLHGTIVHNTGGSAGIVVAPSAQLSMKNTIVDNHTVGVQAEAGGSATLDHTLWWANGTNTQGPGSIVSTGDLSGDPLFTPDNIFYHLQDGSPAIDRGGDAGVTFDIDDAPRPGNSIPDIGVDEHYSGSSIAVGVLGGGLISQEVPEPVENHNGAMVWNGTNWLVHPTWAHKYFYNLFSGVELKPVVYWGTVDGSEGGDVVIVPDQITVAENLYTYTAPANPPYSAIRYQAIDYTITNHLSGMIVRLRSRGSGAGTENASFDVYIQTLTTATTAFRNDPVWFEYPMPIEQAVEQTDPSDYRVGNLPDDSSTDPTLGQYWLDFNGGGDLGPAGNGYSHFMRTAPSSAPGNLGSSSIILYCYRWMDATGQVNEFCVLPRVVSATPIYMLSLPLITR